MADSRTCPICSASDWQDFRGRKLAQCAGCGGLERHRHQFAVLARISGELRGPVLHVAPEPSFARLLATAHAPYVSLDISSRLSPMVRGSILELPFGSGVFGLAYVSHVLEHVPDPEAALREFHRVLGPDGTLIADVPIDSPRSVRIDPEQHQDGHEWSFGPEFLDVYGRVFRRVEHVYRAELPDGTESRRGSPVTVCRS